MSKIYKVFTSIVFLGIVQLSVSQSFLNGVVYVKINESEISFFRGDGLERRGVNLEELLDVYSIEQFESKYSVRRSVFQESAYSHEMDKIYRLKFSEDEDVISKVNYLKSTGMFESVEPSYIFEVQGGYFPNDPYADVLLGTSGSNQLDVHDFYSAWEVEKGDTNVKIGIVDTGTNYDHEDIGGNLAYNYDDPIDSINNDNDLYFGVSLTDNYRGWDAADWDNDPTMGSGSTHGGSMISIIAAEPDNNIGMAGIGFNVKYEPYKAAPDENPNSLTAGYDATYIAALQGCQVVNCSWGSTVVLSQIFEDIINYITNDLDVVIVAAAGNEGNTGKYYPASYDAVISTSAIQKDTVFAYFTSNYNYEVDVAALGHDVFQIRGASTDQYKHDQGTSSASAIVAGLAGLVRSHFPDMTAAQVKKQIISTGDYIDTIPGNETYAYQMGKMINPYKALTDTVSPGLEVVDYSVNNGDTFFVNTGSTVEFDLTILNLLRSSNDVSYKLIALTDNFQFLDSLGVLENIESMDTLTSLGNTIELELFASSDSIEDYVVRIEFTDNTGYHDHQYVQFSLTPTDVTGLANEVSNFTLHPVPFNQEMIVSGLFSKNVTLELFDINGVNYSIDFENQTNALNIKVQDDLPSGTYFIKVNDLDKSEVIKTTKID